MRLPPRIHLVASGRPGPSLAPTRARGVLGPKGPPVLLRRHPPRRRRSSDRYVRRPAGGTTTRRRPRGNGPFSERTICRIRVPSAKGGALARDPRSSVQVWSADYGYPGDGAYLEFHRKHGTDGLRYWRVTDRRIPVAEKVPYDPGGAKEREEGQGDNLASLVIYILR